jgi:glycosyltransferase involved in cell wall biosynthesis
MTKNKYNVLYLGYSGFPYGLAEVQKLILVSKTLIAAGAEVTIVNRRGVHQPGTHPGLQSEGTFEGIKYIYTSGSPFREVGFIKRNLKKLSEKFAEFKCLRRLNNENKIDAAIISSMNFFDVLFYRFAAGALRFKIVLNYVEHNSALTSRKSLKFRINDYLFERYALKLVHGVFPISEFLISILKQEVPHKPWLKIPVMVNMDRYNNIPADGGSKYFLFCGAAAYKEIIFFIIDAYNKVRDDDAYLYLVVNGTPANLNEVKQYISNSVKASRIKVFSNVSDEELSALYKNATALLIPLRPTIQDEARFPHKIGEYLASSNPIITTNYGEIKYYFKDGVNALVAEGFDLEQYANKMNFVTDHPEKSRHIGDEGNKTAVSYFDYKLYGPSILNFFDKL